MGKTNTTATPDEKLSKLLDEFHAGAVFPDPEDTRELGMEAWGNRDANDSYHQVPVQGDHVPSGSTRASLVVTELFGQVAISEHCWVPDKWDRTREYPRLTCFRIFGSDTDGASDTLREIVLAVRAVAAADQAERQSTQLGDERASELAAKYTG